MGETKREENEGMRAFERRFMLGVGLVGLSGRGLPLAWFADFLAMNGIHFF